MKSHTDRTKLEKCDSMKSTFSINLRKAREESGMTQIGLAKRLYISNKTLSNWENKGVEPNFDTIVKLAELLDTTCDYLLTGTDPDNVGASRKYGLSNRALQVLKDLNERRYLFFDSIGKDNYDYVKPIAFINVLLESRIIRDLAVNAIRYAYGKIYQESLETERHGSNSDDLEKKITQLWKDSDAVNQIIESNPFFFNKKIVDSSDYFLAKRYDLQKQWNRILDNVLKNQSLSKNGIEHSTLLNKAWLQIDKLEAATKGESDDQP